METGTYQGKFHAEPFLNDIKKENLNLYHLRIWQDGNLTGTFDRMPVERRDIHSVTKVFTSTAVGFAVSEGLMSMDERVIDCFPEELPETVSENLQEMQLKHLISMTMGFEKPALMMRQRNEARQQYSDWVRYVLAQKVAFIPGEKFLYNNIGPYLLSVLLERRSGKKVTEYLKPRLFDPLGIADVHTIEYCPAGHELGAGGMLLDADELLKFGQLYLNEGNWNGEQLIEREWIRQAVSRKSYTTPSYVEAGRVPSHDNLIGAEYGYQIWLGPDAQWYYFMGSFGTIVLVEPEKKAVISIVSHETEREMDILRILVKKVLPEL